MAAKSEGKNEFTEVEKNVVPNILTPEQSTEASLTTEPTTAAEYLEDCYTTNPSLAENPQTSHFVQSNSSTQTGDHQQSTDEQMTLQDKDNSRNETIRGDPEEITPDSLFLSHIVRRDSAVTVTPCAVLVSGTKGCGKSSNIKHLFHHAIKTSDQKCFTKFADASFTEVDDCLSYCCLAVTGQHSYKRLSWFTPSRRYAVIVCLLAYLADVCKKREYKEFSQITFKSSECTSKACMSNHFVKQLIEELCTELHKEWDTFKINKGLQSEILNGITLINVFDIGPSRAATDFLAFLNKYCKQTVHLVCYDNTRDRQTLRVELVEDTDHHTDLHSTGNQFLRSLKGCVNKDQIVVATAINRGQTSKGEINLTRAIKEKVGTENVHSMVVSKETFENTKKNMEDFGKNSKFHTSVQLCDLVLLLLIKKPSQPRFWIHKDEVELFSKHLQFINGSLDRFLKLFTSFASIFHTHDVPALEDLVITNIVGFIEQLHFLYQINDGLARYGLYQHTDDPDKKIILRFLTGLGIAVNVNSSQIEYTSSELTESSYCYIPSARSSHTKSYAHANDKNADDFIVVSFNENIAENLQACLCNEVLLVGGKLIPTESPDATIMRISENDTRVVELMDFGKDAKITILNDGQLTNKQMKMETFNRILSRYPHVAARSEHRYRYIYQILKVSISGLEKEDLVAVLENGDCKPCVQQRRINTLSVAKQLAKQYKDIKSLASEFKISEEKLKEYEAYQTIFTMMSNVAEEKGQEELEAILKGLGVHQS